MEIVRVPHLNSEAVFHHSWDVSSRVFADAFYQAGEVFFYSECAEDFIKILKGCSVFSDAVPTSIGMIKLFSPLFC